MSEPIYTPAFEALWANEVPDVVRNADANNDWTLKSYMSLLGDVYGEVSKLVDRFTYVAPPDRHLRIPITEVTTDSEIASDMTDARVSVYPDDGTSWVLSAGVYSISTHIDGAFIRFEPYLADGDYTLTFQYQRRSANGVATIVIDGNQVATYTLNASANDNVVLTSAPISFTIRRGYASIKFQYDEAQQSSNTHRINVVSVDVENVRHGYDFDTSDLANPYSADRAWLPWLAMLVGMRTLDQSQSIEAQRDSINMARTGFRAGTRSSMADAVKPYLMGTRKVSIYDHTITNPGDGGQWDVLIVTRGTETPGGLDVPAVVIAANAKPAGVLLHHREYTATWDAVLAHYPHWDDWESVPWAVLEESGLDD